MSTVTEKSKWLIKEKKRKPDNTEEVNLFRCEHANVSKCKGGHLSTFTWVTCLPAGHTLCWHPNCLPLLVLCWASFNRFKHSQRKNIISRCVPIREHMTKERRDMIRRSVYPQPWLWLSFYQTMTSPSQSNQPWMTKFHLTSRKEWTIYPSEPFLHYLLG